MLVYNQAAMEIAQTNAFNRLHKHIDNVPLHSKACRRAENMSKVLLDGEHVG